MAQPRQEAAISDPDPSAANEPTSPASTDNDLSPTTTPLGEGPLTRHISSPSPAHPSSLPPRRATSLRTASDPQPSIAFMNASSTVTGVLDNARRPVPSAGNLPLDLMAKARALQQQRMGMSPNHPGRMPPPGRGGPAGGALSGNPPSNMHMPPNMNRNMTRPSAQGFFQSAPAVPSLSGRRNGGPSLSERRAMKLGPLPGGASPVGAAPKLSDMSAGNNSAASSANRPRMHEAQSASRIDDFKHYIDAEKGWITFEGAATITRTGVNFAGGHAFKISLDEIQVLDELGKGNYGTVYKVRHAKPPVPRFGQGLSGYKPTHPPSGSSTAASSASPTRSTSPISRGASVVPQNTSAETTSDAGAGGDPKTAGKEKPLLYQTTGKVMAMKEIRLELDEAKFGTILKELVILHECVSPYIIDFYGAFFQEGAVYMCIEYMDGGSIDKLYAGGIPEPVLRKITHRTIMGLKSLKDDHNIIHRDVKPTNILANTNGQIKICDFGVSGNLVASIARTNIGCQSYMAPERIAGGGVAQGGANAEGTYSVQSDIWSLGLTIIECAMGRYPYPPEVSSTIFSQLSAIVNGEPPDMPDGYSATARDFVRSCLNKNPKKRYTYAMLLSHPWIKALAQAETTIEEVEEPGEADLGEDADAGTDSVADLGKGVSDLELDDGQSTEAESGTAGDAEIAAWVVSALEQKKTGSAPAGTTKPALHAAPLAP